MTPSSARSAIRWAVSSPKNVEVAAKSLWSDIGEIAPSVLSVAGAYLLSEQLSKEVGEKVEKTASGGEQIEPPENYLSWQKEMVVQEGMRRESVENSRGAIKRILAKGAGRKICC